KVARKIARILFFNILVARISLTVIMAHRVSRNRHRWKHAVRRNILIGPARNDNSRSTHSWILRNNPTSILNHRTLASRLTALWIGTLGGSAPGASGVWTSASISSFSLRR